MKIKYNEQCSVITQTKKNVFHCIINIFNHLARKSKLLKTQ